MEQLHFDIVIIGMGLGATAIAHQLALSGANIAMTPGVGCARFKHLDGGLIEPRQLGDAFGTSAGAPIHAMSGINTFRRDELEAWAINRVRGRVSIVDGFDDLQVVPLDADMYSLREESGQRETIARQIILTEGASPRIGIAGKIRTDFEPEDLLHFGRAILPGVNVVTPTTAMWRTSWGMPAWFSAIPHPDGAMVSAAARIENIMRATRDGREVLKDFLESPIAREIGLPDAAGNVGMELAPLRQADDSTGVSAPGILITPDANGSIDPRSLDRFVDVLRTGSAIGAIIAREWPHVPDWDETGTDIWTMPVASRTPYHDSSQTGFVEEGAGRSRGMLRKVFRR